jgi:glutamate-1-semialdehyde 2,1-aminomutase
MLEAGLRSALTRLGAACQLARVGSMWTLFFTRAPVRDWTGAATSDRVRYARFFHAMLERGIVLAPSQFEANFISAAHTRADIDATVQAAAAALEIACA